MGGGIVYMSSGVFRGKESSKRIELSRLVQDLLNFGVLGSLWLWGGGRWVGSVFGAWGVSPHMCTHMYMHAQTCMHVQKLQMAADMEASMFIMFNMHVHACVCACVCVYMGHPPIHPYPPPPHQPTNHPQGDLWNQ